MEYRDLTLAQKALYDESSVHMTDAGPLLMLAFESARKKYPHYAFMDDDWKPVSRCLLAYAAAHLKHAPTRTRDQPVPHTSQGSSTRAQLKNGMFGGAQPKENTIEARVRELAGERLVQVAVLNKVVVAIHPTNPGITAMRRKNALLTLVRRGVGIRL